jgi:predicted O-methyltransferase YrrM
MDAERFLRELPALFDDFPRSGHPRDRRFADVLERLDGLACENNLALVNLAASLLAPDECYVEIGTFKGASLVAAMLGNEEHDFVAVDSFALAGGSRARLETNVRGFGLEPPEILEGDVFELLHGGALDGRSIGVCYWDLLHKYEPQLAGLRLLERHLAPGAVVIVDDSDWEGVELALADYFAGQPRARRLLTLGGDRRGQPWWWEGVVAYAWDGVV